MVFRKEYYQMYVNLAPIQDIRTKSKIQDDMDETEQIDQSNSVNETASPVKYKDAHIAGEETEKDEKDEDAMEADDAKKAGDKDGKGKLRKRNEKQDPEVDSKKKRKNLNKYVSE